MSIKADCHLHSSFSGDAQAPMPEMIDKGISLRSEERRVGKECRSRWSPYH